MGKKLEPIGEKLPLVLELGQFNLLGGQCYCFRKSCDDCRWQETCRREETSIQVGPGISIRRAVVAREGFLLVAIDFKQVEIRVAAQLSREPFWIDCFNRDVDLHTEMAKKAFHAESPTKEQRRRAKCANFGNLFLGSPYTLSAQSEMDIIEAKYVHSQWWKTVAVYKKWTDGQLAFGLKNGYVETFLGRRRNVRRLVAQYRELEPSGGQEFRRLKGLLHRICVNTPVQGTAADLMKLGMVRVHAWIQKHNLSEWIHPLLTVHDELVLEIDASIPSRFAEHCRGVASELVPEAQLRESGWVIPLGSDIEIGRNWAELEDLADYEERHGLRSPKKPEDSGGGSSGGPSPSTGGPEAPAVPITPSRRRAVVRVQDTMTMALESTITKAIVRAQAIENVLLTPLELEIQGCRYVTHYRVHEPTLEMALRDCPKVNFEGI